MPWLKEQKIPPMKIRCSNPGCFAVVNMAFFFDTFYRNFQDRKVSGKYGKYHCGKEENT
ncbi:MAG: hypothetical protein V8S08_06595 [Lachnoclostridium sp.]